MHCVSTLVSFFLQVWPNHKANLILMERYHFFSSSSRQFAVGSPSLAQMRRDESESDGTLATTLKVLRAIHHGYFHKPLDQVSNLEGYQRNQSLDYHRYYRLSW